MTSRIVTDNLDSNYVDSNLVCDKTSLETTRDVEKANRGSKKEDSGDVVDSGDEACEDNRQPDGGWGWFVVFGSFVTTMLLPLLGPGFGVVFSRYLIGEGSSSTTTAWIFNTHCFMWNIMGMLVRPLASEFGWRNVAMTGSLVAFIAVLLSAFTPSPQFLFFSFSLLAGAGGGVVVCMSFIIVPLYFNRRRGMANAIMMAGLCSGQMFGPPLIRFLQDEYGYQGATLVFSAIILNSCVGAAFFHPVEWHLKPCPKPRQGALESTMPLISNNDKVKEAEKEAKEAQESTIPLISDNEKVKEKNNGASKTFMENGSKEGIEWVSIVTQARAKGETSTRHVILGSQVTPPSSETESVVLSVSSVSAVKQNCVNMENKKDCGWLIRVLRSTLSDLAILRSPRALIISLGCMLFINGYYNFIMLVPFAMQAADHSLQDAAWCISVSAICNMAGRTLMSALSDYSWFNMRFAYMAGLFTTASSILVFPLVHSLSWLLVVMAVWGLGIGTSMGLYSLIMVRFMGVRKLPPVYGASSLALALGFLSIGPVVGVIRDVSNSYAISMWFLSGLIFTSFVLWLFMPAAQAYDQRRKEQGDTLPIG